MGSGWGGWRVGRAPFGLLLDAQVRLELVRELERAVVRRERACDGWAHRRGPMGQKGAVRISLGVLLIAWLIAWGLPQVLGYVVGVYFV